VTRAEFALPDRQRATEKRFCLVVSFLCIVERREIVEARREVQKLARFLVDLLGSFEKRLCLIVAAKDTVKLPDR
jgi:hypothetical protein